MDFMYVIQFLAMLTLYFFFFEKCRVLYSVWLYLYLCIIAIVLQISVVNVKQGLFLVSG